MTSKRTIYLIVDYYFPKSNKIHAQMTEELALGMQDKGYKVVVIAPDEENIYKNIINIRGVDVKFFKNPKIKDIGLIKRTINELLLSFNAFIQLRGFMKKNKPDLIVFFSPSIFFGPYVLFLKFFHKINTYLVLRDIFPQWAVDLGLIKKNRPIHIFFKIFEKINYMAASNIGLESPSGLKKFRSDFSSYNSELLFNWVQLGDVPPKKYSIRKTYNLSDKIIFFYGGNIGIVQDIPNILNLAKQFLNEDKAHFVIVGDGDKFLDTQLRISKHKLKNVLLLRGVTPEIYLDYLQEIDIGMISLNKDNSGNNIPGKLLNYMKLKKPILGSVNKGNDIIDVINNSKAGLISINGEHEAFFNNATKMLLSPERSIYSENSFKLISDKFSIENALDTILNHNK